MNKSVFGATIDALDKELNILEGIRIFESSFGHPPDCLTISPVTADRFFGNYWPVSILGIQVDIDSRCPPGECYFSDSSSQEI